MDKNLADTMKDLIDKNIFEEIEKLAKIQGYTTSGWIRNNLWNCIKEQRDNINVNTR